MIVIGRRIGTREWTGMNPKSFEKLAVEAFIPLSPLFKLHEPRTITRQEQR
jgi:hypothetical protein